MNKLDYIKMLLICFIGGAIIMKIFLVLFRRIEEYGDWRKWR